MDLLFSNPVFHKGLNLTVRNGQKWYKSEFSDNKNWTVPILKTDDQLDESGNKKIINYAHIDHTYLFKFSEIPEKLLCIEHDPECRTLDGLFNVMSKVYPGFSREDMVTLVFFETKKED